MFSTTRTEPCFTLPFSTSRRNSPRADSFEKCFPLNADIPSSRKVSTKVAALIVLGTLLHAQTATVSPPPDSIVQVTAEAQGLEPVASADLPSGGTFWLVTSNGIAAPSPCPPGNLSDFPVYLMADGIYLVDETVGQVVTNEENSTIESALAAQADSVTGLINQVQDAQFNQDLALAFGFDMEMDSSSSFAPMFAVTDPTALWLEITNVSNGWSYFNLHNGTNFVYAILSTTSLAGGTWNIETELFPTLDQNNVMAFAVQNLGRQILFVKAMDWTGVDSDSDGIPDWWIWKYFGNLSETATNLDGQGNTLLSDYTNNLVPAAFSFSGIEVTNNYISTISTTAHLDVTGWPYYVAVLVDDTNFNDAVWNTYTSSNVAVTLGFTQGWHDVRIGLRGHADDPTNAVWQWKRIDLDYTPPQLTITNPVGGTVSVPVVQLQGFANEELSSLTYDVSNATGIFTNQPGYWQPVFYDTNQLSFTTNNFQCYDIPLTNGVNTIAVHATDLAGNTATTNINLTLDYSGDHTAPNVSVVWPQDGTSIVDTNFTLQATVDDATATITAAIVDGSGDTNTVTASVQRDGTVLAQNLPLATGTNTLTIIATDAAGNASTNSLTVYQSGVLVTVDPLTQLNQASVTVTGTISDSSYDVSVNGTNAYYVDDVGDWEADGVPVSPSGAAILDVEVSGGGSGGMSLRAFGGGLFRTDNLSSDTTGGSQQLVVPQPPMVGLMSYDGHQYFAGASTGGGSYVDISAWDEEAEDAAHWTYQGGGEDMGYAHYSGSPYPYEPSYDYGWDDYLMAGDGGFQPDYYAESFFDVGMWENVDMTTNGGPTTTRPTFTWSESDNTQTRVMIEPAKPLTAGATVNYIVRAQAWDKESDVQLTSSAVQIRGVALTELTNSDSSVWGYMTFSAPSGAMPEVTPKAKGNYTFNAQTVKTKEDWQQEVRTEINQDSGYTAIMTEYLAANGFSLQNRTDMKAVYAFYQKIYFENPTGFLWAGLAKLAGAPVYAGLSDAQNATVALTGFQQTLIQMNIDILNDIAWQFEAYRKGGIDALEEIYVVDFTHSALDIGAITAWRQIDQGIKLSQQTDPSGPILILEGNEALLQREQQQILPPSYALLSSFDTTLMTIFAKCPVWDPSTSEPWSGRDFLSVMGSGSHNVADTTDRWNWITTPTTGIWDTWSNMSLTDKATQVSTPLTTRAVNYSTLPAILFNY